MSEHIPVRQFMTTMPTTIEDDLELGDAKVRMYELGVHHLPVVHDGQLVGILSARDIAVAEALTTMDPQRIPVAKVMSAVPFTCGPNAHLEAVAREMAEHHYGSAVVVDREHPGHIVGVFTTTDALRALSEVLAARSG
jgi:acetoin utilization protein AcuB